MEMGGLWIRRIRSRRASYVSMEPRRARIGFVCLKAPVFKENMRFCFQYVWQQADTEAGDQAAHVGPFGDCPQMKMWMYVTPS